MANTEQKLAVLNSSIKANKYRTNARNCSAIPNTHSLGMFATACMNAFTINPPTFFFFGEIAENADERLC